MVTEYITKKIPKEADQILKYVQAQEQLEKGERMSEAEIIHMALKHYQEEKYGKMKKPKYKFSDLIGNDKSSKKSHPNEVDQVVYGL